VPLTEERVRYYASLNDPAMHGQTIRFSFDEAAQLAADWLALRAQNAALRAMVEEAYRDGHAMGTSLAIRGSYVVSRDSWHSSPVAARLAALGEP